MKLTEEKMYKIKFRNLRIENTSVAEWIAALGITVIAVSLHLVFMHEAAGLWRDEISTLNLAIMPDFMNVLNTLKLDSFPVLSSIVIRTWTTMGGGTDAGLRIFGMLVGIAILGTFWFNASIFERRPPLIGLVLIGLSPIVIRFGDAIRPYGLGVLISLIAFGLYWQTTFSPSLKRIILATLAGVLMVHCLYQNAFLLSTIGFGAIIVCIRRKKWDRALLIAAMELFTALTLLPYIGIIEKASEWTILVKEPETIHLQDAAIEAFGSPKTEMIWVWLFLFVAGLVVCIKDLIKSENSKDSERIQPKDSTLYAFTVLVASTTAYLLFLDSTRVYIRSWYYLPIICISALCLDILLGDIPRGAIPRIALVIILIFAFGKDSWHNVKIRQTNVDLIAAQLEKVAHKDDLILISPWYIGITFAHYYKGETPWSSVPPIDDLNITRWDLIAKRMINPEPMNFLVAQATKTLIAGNIVWVVGDLPRAHPDFRLPSFTPPPHPETGWLSHTYRRYWGLQIFLALRAHVHEVKVYAPHIEKTVNPLENAKIEMYKAVKNCTFNIK